MQRQEIEQHLILLTHLRIRLHDLLEFLNINIRISDGVNDIEKTYWN